MIDTNVVGLRDGDLTRLVYSKMRKGVPRDSIIYGPFVRYQSELSIEMIRFFHVVLLRSFAIF
jgi:hypothetical protein